MVISAHIGEYVEGWLLDNEFISVKVAERRASTLYNNSTVYTNTCSVKSVIKRAPGHFNVEGKSC